MTDIKPGLYDGLDETTYHGHKGSLSVSGAKKLLPPSCPAIFKWERDNGQPHKAAFDFGHAAHSVVLGAGADIKVVDAPDWRTKAAKADADEIRAAGHIPMLAHEWTQVLGMAEAIKAHPIASALLDPERGRPEVSVFWEDKQRGIDRRARLDWLPSTDGGRLVVPDYKTTNSAEPRAFARSVFSFGYDMQAVFYMDAVRAAELAEDVSFVFIAQEKTAPYLITVHELDFASLLLGRERVDEACAVFRECTETDTWPGYSDQIELIPPPAWLSALYGLDDMDMVA